MTSRREFLKTSGVAAGAVALPVSWKPVNPPWWTIVERMKQAKFVQDGAGFSVSVWATTGEKYRYYPAIPAHTREFLIDVFRVAAVTLEKNAKGEDLYFGFGVENEFKPLVVHYWEWDSDFSINDGTWTARWDGKHFLEGKPREVLPFKEDLYVPTSKDIYAWKTWKDRLRELGKL